MKKALAILTVCFYTLTVAAQEKWDLRRCVEYALENNISIKQADIQARFDKLTHDQSVLAQYPSLSSQHSTGFQFGRSIDPTSNQFTNNQIFFANHSVDLGWDLFNWFRKRNTAESNKYLAQASEARLEKARNDIALNVANAYLAALLNKEQVNISKVQLSQSREQLELINKQVKAGALPELNLAEAETQYATDSSNLITAQTNYTLSLLQLKALLNLDAAMPFDIAEPPVDAIPVESLSELDPEVVYQSALENLPQQKANELTLKALEKNAQAAKAAMYPSLMLFGGLNARYANAQKLLPQGLEVVNTPIGTVEVNGVAYTVTAPITQPTSYERNTYFRQLKNNFNQNIGIGVSIPIFNGGMARINWQKAKLNVENQSLQKEQETQTLKQDIYQAHTNAVAAIEKFNASRTAVQAAQKAYDYARKRFEVGLLQPIDLITTQNNLYRAKINMVSAQYDYVFKMKLLEFYKGKGLKLESDTSNF